MTLACAAITAIWLLLRARFTIQVDAAYELTFGRNVLRNMVAFAGWMAGVPREAVRMAAGGDHWRALAWMALTALPMLVASALACWQGRPMLRARQWLAVSLFAGIAYGPYFLLAWNSYPYYAAVAAILPAIVVAHCSAASPRVPVILALLALASWSAVEGTRMLDHPGLIGRARWGERLLGDLQRRNLEPPLWVAVRDDHRFYAVGLYGLAWRLQLPVDSIHLARQCPATARQCLRIDDDGVWQVWGPRDPSIPLPDGNAR